jgi:hypothetical protein
MGSASPTSGSQYGEQIRTITKNAMDSIKGSAPELDIELGTKVSWHHICI